MVFMIMIENGEENKYLVINTKDPNGSQCYWLASYQVLFVMKICVNPHE